MYLGTGSLKELESLVHGYYTGLSVHGIVETVPMMTGHFMTWLNCHTMWSCSCGWAAAIEQSYPDRDKALAKFFEFVDEYRKLKPVVLRTVRLAARHEPTGNRVRIGCNTLMKKPRRVDVIRYQPEPLYFLRFHYPNRVVNGELLMTNAGQYETSLHFAKQWARDELKIEFAAWERAT
jgi:hypothetical protein